MQVGDWVAQYRWVDNPNYRTEGHETEGQPKIKVYAPENAAPDKWTIIALCRTNNPDYIGDCRSVITWMVLRNNQTGYVLTIGGGCFESPADFVRAMNYDTGAGLDELQADYPLPCWCGGTVDEDGRDNMVVLNDRGERIQADLDSDEERPYPWDYVTTDDFDVVTPKLYVNIYLTDRRWGGSEEGGWWYDVQYPQYSVCSHALSEKLAEELYRVKKEWCDEQNTNRNSDISSVASEGKYIVVREAWPPQVSPKERPRYC